MDVSIVKRLEMAEGAGGVRDYLACPAHSGRSPGTGRTCFEGVQLIEASRFFRIFD
jgi:hypothetical protein